MTDTPVPTRVPGLAGDLILPASAYARDRRPWLAARRQGLGASESAVLLGFAPSWWQATPFRLWREKVTDDAPVDRSPNEAATWGSRLEAPVAVEFARRNPHLGKLKPTPGLLRHDDCSTVLATLDRLIVPRRVRDALPTAALEVKTTSERVYRKHWIDGVPPAHVQVQVQQQLAVTGLDHIYVAVLVGGQYMPDPYLIERDDAIIDPMLTYVTEWWQRHIVDGIRPALTRADSGILTDVYPGDTDLDPLAATPDVLRHFAEYLDARRVRDEAVELMDAHVFEVKKHLGDHTALTDEHGTVLATYRPTKTGRSFRVKENAAP